MGFRCRGGEYEFGLSRDLLVDILKAENVIARRYFYPGLHRSIPYVQELPQYLDGLPVTDKLCSSVIQLPIGALVTPQDVECICDIIDRAHKYSSEIRSRHEK